MSTILFYVTSSFSVPDLDHRPSAGKRMGADLGSGSCDFTLASASNSLALVPVTPDDAGDVSCAAHVGTRSSGVMRSLLHLSRGCVQLFLDELDSAYDCRQVLANCLTGLYDWQCSHCSACATVPLCVPPFVLFACGMWLGFAAPTLSCLDSVPTLGLAVSEPCSCYTLYKRVLCLWDKKTV